MQCDKIGWWGAFLDSIDTGGGYIVGFFLLMAIGLYLMRLGYDMIGATFLSSALAAYLTRTKDSRSNRDQVTTSPTSPTLLPSEQPQGDPK